MVVTLSEHIEIIDVVGSNVCSVKFGEPCFCIVLSYLLILIGLVPLLHTSSCHCISLMWSVSIAPHHISQCFEQCCDADVVHWR